MADLISAMQNQAGQRELNPREKLLREAEGIVTKDRNTAYGNPEDNFGDIAALQSAYMKGKTTVSKMDVVCLNILTKIARLRNNPGHRDSLVDIAGYAACGADIQAGMAKSAGGVVNRGIQQPYPHPDFTEGRN